MGDTGSLALGGALAVAAVMMNIELILPIAGGIFLVEVLSVIIQGGQLQDGGERRVFRMGSAAPSFRTGRMERDESCDRFLDYHTSALHIIDISAVK